MNEFRKNSGSSVFPYTYYSPGENHKRDTERGGGALEIVYIKMTSVEGAQHHASTGRQCGLGSQNDTAVLRDFEMDPQHMCTELAPR